MTPTWARELDDTTKKAVIYEKYRIDLGNALEKPYSITNPKSFGLAASDPIVRE